MLFAKCHFLSAFVVSYRSHVARGLIAFTLSLSLIRSRPRGTFFKNIQPKCSTFNLVRCSSFVSVCFCYDFSAIHITILVIQKRVVFFILFTSKNARIQTLFQNFLQIRRIHTLRPSVNERVVQTQAFRCSKINFHPVSLLFFFSFICTKIR